MTQGLRRILQALLHIEDTPHRTALAFGVGVLIAFSPFLGIHMGIALLVAFLFRLNRVAILLGTYLNNPWTLAPIYLAGTSLGCLLLGISRDGLDTIDWELTGWAFLQGLWTTLRRYVWPFLLGNAKVDRRPGHSLLSVKRGRRSFLAAIPGGVSLSADTRARCAAASPRRRAGPGAGSRPAIRRPARPAVTVRESRRGWRAR